MTESDPPKRQRPNADQRRALKSATVTQFTRKYGRKAQRGIEPNDRKHDRDVEKVVKRMAPEELDRLVRDDEE
jgi:hypothetical protein